MYLSLYPSLHIYIYIYIYIERERDTHNMYTYSLSLSRSLSLSLSVRPRGEPDRLDHRGHRGGQPLHGAGRSIGILYSSSLLLYYKLTSYIGHTNL